MKINKIAFSNKTTGWVLEEATFENLTLLVGASGVGKTLILKTILVLKQIANGNTAGGAKWMIDVIIGKKNHYVWEGEFENADNEYFIIEDYNEIEKNRPKILNEVLILNNEVLVNRNHEETLFKGKKTLKFSQQQSIINILKEEEAIKPIYDGFKKITFSGSTIKQDNFFRLSTHDVKKFLLKYNTTKKIQDSDHNINLKLYLLSKFHTNLFESIKAKFCEIFPQVQDIKVGPLEFNKKALPASLKEVYFIQMKEAGVAKWILQSNISAGMFKTLVHISELHLSPSGTIFLIDEFENSLGINCIDQLTDEILHSERQLQFIITSHHPYIINNIDFSCWRLVTRKSGAVKTSPIDKFISGKSKHEKFMQLMQLKQYETGID